MENLQEKGLLIKYSLSEKLINSISHGIGAILMVIGLIFLLLRADTFEKRMGALVYGLCIVIMLFNSCLYHSLPMSKFSYVMRAIDHSSIFLAIAGTYTPLLIICFNGWVKFILILMIWLVALVGISIKIISFSLKKVKKTEKISIVLYLGMGWISLFLIPKILTVLGLDIFIHILIGGILYSIGVIFYGLKKIPYNHAIWHFFILFAVMEHYLAIFLSI